MLATLLWAARLAAQDDFSRQPPIYRGISKAQTATIHGSVRDTSSGQPIRGAFVAARWPARQGREQTDSNGRFTLDWVEPGMVYLDLHCPSRTLLGDSLSTAITKAKVGDSTLHELTVDLSRCTEPDSGSWGGVYRGIYREGFEESSFRFCPDATLLPLVAWAVRTERHAWATFAGTKRSYSHPGWKLQNDKYYPWWYVVARGVVTGPGGFGHLGVSSLGFEVDSVLDVRSVPPSDCKIRDD